MTVLIDGKEAFGSAADDMEAATTSLNMTQLFFTTPDYKLDAGRRAPEAGLLVRAADHRPARPAALRAGAARRSRDRRTAGRSAWSSTRPAARSPCGSSSTSPVASWPEGVFWLLALPAAAAGVGTGAVGWWPWSWARGWRCSRSSSAWPSRSCSSRRSLRRARRSTAAPTSRSYRRYMAKGLADIPQPRGDIIVRGFEQPAPDNGVLHTKMVIADGQRATVLGSPYSQRYFDDPRHQIDNPERGRHDVRHRPRRQHRPGRPGGRRPARDVPGVLERGPDPGQPDPVAAARAGRQGAAQRDRRGGQGPGRPHPQRRPVQLPRRDQREGHPRELPAGVRPGEAVHLPGEPVLHRRDHRRRPGQGPQGQARPGADLPAQHQAGRHALPRPPGPAGASSCAPRRPTGSASSPAGPTTTPIRDRGSRPSTCTPRWRSSTTPGRPSARPTSTGSRSTTTPSSARSPSARPRPPS